MEEVWFALRYKNGENKGKIVAVENFLDWPIDSIFDKEMVKEDDLNALQYLLKEHQDMELSD